MMGKNVIEQFADDLRDREDMQTYEEVADELQAATRPEQFMPRLDEWPEDAEWCTANVDGACRFHDMEPNRNDSGWEFGTALGGASEVITIPLGIDWRTLKVSREQMEAWEAER